MKRQSTKSLLKKVFSDLDWPILESATDMPTIRIVSDQQHKSHFMYVPKRDLDKSSHLDYLHELGHATLCERVHPVFASNGQFPLLANKKRFLQMLPALGSASDWFVCHWQRGLLPQQMDAVIRESLPTVEEILAQKELPPVEIILDAAFLIAQAVHYLDEPLECGGVLKDLVDAFLSVPPDAPSADRLQLLVNKIMASYTQERVQLVPEDGRLVWDLVEPETAPARSAAAGASA